MAKRSQKLTVTKTDLANFVTVVFAEDMQRAAEYESLLKDNNIKAAIKEQDHSTPDRSDIAVMVPEQFLDEAHAIIESQNMYDDFCDLMGDNESLQDFDEDEEDDFYDDRLDDEY